MFDTFLGKLNRFLSIFGGFSNPEDIRRARERGKTRRSFAPPRAGAGGTGGEKNESETRSGTPPPGPQE